MRAPLTVESLASSALALDAQAGLFTTFSHEAIETLPLTGSRTLQSLLSLVPGIVVTDSVGTLAQFTTAGQRRFANRLTIDSVNADLAVDTRGLGIGEAGSGALPAVATSGGTQTLVPFGAIDGMTVRTTNASAEYAQTPGAQTAIVTRAGTDNRHGDAFLTGRPAGLSAADWFHSASAEKQQASALNGGAPSGRGWSRAAASGSLAIQR